MNNPKYFPSADSDCRYDLENKILFLSEYSVLKVYENYERGLFKELYEIPRQSNLIQVDEKIIEKEKCLVFSAGHKVGIEKAGNITVYVLPKIKNADFLTMVNYAFDFNFDFQREKVYLEQDSRNLTGVFLKFILLQLQVFLSRELRRSFVKRQEQLSSKVKGKVLLSEYLKNSLPSKKDTLIPCQFYEIKVDCLENQIIRYTIEMVQKVLQNLVFSQSLRKEMTSLCNSMLQRMAGVSFRRIALNDFNRVRYIGRFKHNP